MKVNNKITKFFELQGCPRFCPICGAEDSVVDIGDGCYCQACSCSL